MNNMYPNLSFFIMNKKNILIILAFIILSSLLILYAITLYQTQQEIIIMNKIFGLTLHIFSIKTFDLTGQGIDYAEIVRGNEAQFCEAINGFWNEDTRKCHNVSYENCRIITGTMIEDQESNETSCILP